MAREEVVLKICSRSSALKSVSRLQRVAAGVGRVRSYLRSACDIEFLVRVS